MISEIPKNYFISFETAGIFIRLNPQIFPIKMYFCLQVFFLTKCELKRNCYQYKQTVQELWLQKISFVVI